MRLIDLDTLLQFLESQNCASDWLVNMYNADWIASWLESQPIIEIEVVRCKDCVLGNPSKFFGDIDCRILGVPMKNDDFCSYGERRDDT